MKLNIPTLIARWNRLKRYDRDAWKIADKARDEDTWVVYSSRLRRVEAIRAKILNRYSRLKSAGLSGCLTHTITWGPTEQLETYEAEEMVISGRVARTDLRLTGRDWEAIKHWRPILTSMSDCESSQGFIYSPPEDVAEVVERLKTLGCKARASLNQIDLVQPPVDWNIASCWPAKKPGESPANVKPLVLEVPA